MANHDYSYLVSNLISRDFKIRYRNMSLGILWSLINPVIMMAVLWFVFTRIFPNNNIPNFHVFVLCGIVPYNFFTLGWMSATTSIVDNAGLIKRVRFPRELIAVSTVLANSVHILIQIGLLLVLAAAAGYLPTWKWLWLIYVFGLELVFICGIGLISAALDVYFRDVRYLVESANVVLFWLVPIFYRFEDIAPAYHWIYRFNPVAAVVMACRQILLEQRVPAPSLLQNLALVSVASVVAGLFLFHSLQRRFSDYL